jgi:hypothetical protein
VRGGQKGVVEGAVGGAAMRALVDLALDDTRSAM